MGLFIYLFITFSTFDQNWDTKTKAKHRLRAGYEEIFTEFYLVLPILPSFS